MKVWVFTRFIKICPGYRKVIFRKKSFDSVDAAIEYLRFRVDHPSERSFRFDLSVELDKNKK